MWFTQRLYTQIVYINLHIHESICNENCLYICIIVYMFNKNRNSILLVLYIILFVYGYVSILLKSISQWGNKEGKDSSVGLMTFKWVAVSSSIAFHIELCPS